MLVKLPRECSGQEILEAFKAASTFEEIPERQWRPNEFAREIQYEPGSVRQTIRSMGVRVYSSSLKKKWGLFGEKVWKLSNSRFALNPVALLDRYDEVEMAIEYYGGFDGMWFPIEPNTPDFERIRPQLERALADFFARLQPQAT